MNGQLTGPEASEPKLTGAEAPGPELTGAEAPGPELTGAEAPDREPNSGELVGPPGGKLAGTVGEAPGGNGSGGRPPGSSIFSIEGRAAPGLYLVGWLGTVMGVALLLGAIALGQEGPPGFVLVTASLTILSIGLVSAAGAQSLQRRARQVPAYQGPSPFLVFAASLALTILLVVIVGRPAAALGLDLESSVGAFISVSITASVYVGLIRLLVVGTGALSWSDMGLSAATLERVAGELLWGASFAIPTLFVTGLLGFTLIRLLGVAPESPLPAPHDQATLLLNLVSAGAIAPVGEELFFRAFATTAWLRSFGPRRAVVQGAVFFAVIHVLTVSGVTFGDAAAKALIVFAVRLPVSVGLGLAFVRRRSVFASIGMHAAFNGIQVLVTGIALGGLGPQ